MPRMLLNIIVLVAVTLQTSVAAAQCGMSLLKRHGTANTAIYQARQGAPSLYFRANVDVNTDGASRSYHPADPRGQSLALNNMGNALTGIWNAQGQKIDCTPRRGACFMRYINTFIAARNAQWNPVGHPRVATTHIIPWRHDAVLGRSVPCTIATGPYAGYFVSQTAFEVDTTKPACDQARYLDSLTFNAAVLPRGAVWTSLGSKASVGDMVVVHVPATNRIAYAIIGDSGPAAGIGEGTIALAAQLRGASVSPTATYAQVKALALGDARYLLFPDKDVRSLLPRGFAQADVDRVGAALFTAWGGPARLAQCGALPR